MNIKKSYKFAFKSATAIIFFVALALYALNYFSQANLSLTACLIFIAVIYLFAFFLLQYRIEKFIYNRVQKIYKHLVLLDPVNAKKLEIRNDMNTLLKEVEQFTSSKKIEIDNLKIQEEYRRDFLGNVAHELKTPLFTVQGYLETLLDGAMHDKSVREKYLERAQNGVDRLIYIVNDLDLITKIESDVVNLNKTNFDIVELFKEVFELLELNADKKGIILLFDRKHHKPIYVKADKDKIRQVLINLVENSIKYGNEKGSTEVSIEPLIKNKLIVKITDNGLGIDKKNLPRVFERFYRVDKSGARSQGGSGLGLAIVKHIIEAHQERIYVNSELKKGSEFSFTLELGQELLD
ncbi:cell wall metabolism sensor histidine kinase WalK [Flavobacterium agricola]|uniref:histidine kinase n=1 Tax=Flavobacterium agricola TaxID=2870839 RepID=A0ABY6LYH1_9FLAO|nr:cell wall metabolism sensor histidine kinase WalK [Flavobacterium agricola]UYW01289.1 cell wall metabolism sensor histidine kinase WalK [Flavobacterium agricola]